MEIGLLGRVLFGVFFAAIAWTLWKTAAPTRWHKAFILFWIAVAIFLLAGERMLLV